MIKPMICIPIVGRTKAEILETAKKYASLAAQLVEWRIDFYEDIADYNQVVCLARTLRDIFPQKLLVTWRTSAEGGENVSQQVSYTKMLEQLIAAGACDYIDMEMAREDAREAGLLALAKEKNISVIGSFHNFQETPTKEDMVERLQKMKDLGYTVGKIAVMPQQEKDVEQLLEATQEMKQRNPNYPLITMSMGSLGVVSRLYGWLYGSSVTFASAGKASAPGQVEIEVVEKALSLGAQGKRHIILVGFMGTGKSTVSHELARLTGCQEIDTDEYIVNHEGRAIKEIFAKQGEDYFRQLETEMINDLDAMDHGIVSCGGGMVLRDINIKKLQQVGTIVLLTATPATIYHRVKDNTDRPLLNGNMNVEYIQKLLEQRQPAYERAAEIVISTDEKTEDMIAQEILSHFDGFSVKSS